MTKKEKIMAIVHELLGLLHRAHDAADAGNLYKAEGLIDDIAHVAATTDRGSDEEKQNDNNNR